MNCWTSRLAAFAAVLASAAMAADLPSSKEGDWIAPEFRFHTGEVLKDVRMHYVTFGDPKNDAILVLHGTGGSSQSMLTPGFAGLLFGPGQPLDASRYYIIVTDALGAGKSAKPSDGLRAKFPRYDYDDMVEGQHRLLIEHLGVKHLRMVIGNSMGGMQAWMWAGRYPGYVDIAVPMACLPTAMSGRNWIMRRLLVDSIRGDPGYLGGEYKEQPHGFKMAAAFYGYAMAGGNQALYKAAPTSESGDKLVNARLAAPFKADANDFVYQWESSYDYDPSPGLERITATVLAINAADDERNPPELGILDREIQRVKNGRVLLIPASPETSGHLTTGSARFYKDELARVLREAPRL
ncbi:MAG TPA: alpha/beta fold hydrolase [Usitatibacter sp.]|jgi:homoserine O-acetyltransferase|nr:alpha/beta fold hydrolase [Usitatibacter sp.]